MGLNLTLAFIISFIVTAGFGYFLVPMLRRMKAGQTIREDGPVWHKNKQGTPTMGGIMFITGVTVACLAIGYRDIIDGDYSHVISLLLALIFAAIGFLDDFKKLKKKQNMGLNSWQKFLLQLVVAVGFLLLLRYNGALTTNLYIPFINTSFAVPAPVYYVFAAFVIIGTVNAVNITDGVDGLATGVSIPVAACFTLIAYYHYYGSAGILAAALLGALPAFLIFNFHPAKAFMGDTGSMFLGGLICALAFAMDIPLILIPLGIVFLLETMSDIIQVTYFKLTHGKRIFKMAPIHHHFEMCGWSEYKLFIVFTSVSVVFAALSFYGVYYK